MMTSNRHQAAFSTTAQHVCNASNNALPQSPCGAPSDMIRKSKSKNAADEVGVENIHDAMAAMKMKDGNAVPATAEAESSSTKENVRPNSGRKKWRNKKLDQKQRRAIAAAIGQDERAVADAAIEDDLGTGGQLENSTEKKTKNGNGRKLHLKNKKAVIVEISSQKTSPLPGLAHRVPILPPRIDRHVGAVDGGSSPPSGGGGGNGDSPPSGVTGGRVKKSRPHKNKKHPSSRHRSKKGVRAHGAANEFSTNAGGASVLALIGHRRHPYDDAGPPVAEISCYDGSSSSPPNSRMMMPSGVGDDGGNYYARYDPSYGPLPNPGASSIPSSTYAGHDAYQGVQYASYAAHDLQQHQGATVMMAAGYYIPVMMTHHNGVVYYDQHTGAAEYPSYYPSYVPYGTVADQPSVHHQHASCTPGKALNIDAPAFNPKENNDK